MAASITTSGASIEAQAYEIALRMQKLELAVPAETRPNNITVTYDIEASTVSFTTTLETQLTVVNGKAEIAALPYLA
ncbi:MAG: hypothetical protein HC930_01250 [Hydrococcus sp. SU_1_0]|nr:hypothetical protein [Hydrococcus sp. SU_1_0]